MSPHSAPSCAGVSAVPTLVIGLGNPIRGDDGVGPEVARRLAERCDLPPGVEVAVDTHGGLRLMERLVGYRRAVIVDATQTGAPPGTLRTLAPDDVSTAHSGCTHDTGLSTALALGRLAGADLPDDDGIRLVGVEVADVQTFFEGLSPRVEAAVPQAVARVIDLLTGRSHGFPRPVPEVALGRPLPESMMVSPEILRRYSYFTAGGEDALAAIAMIAEEIHVKAGQALFEEGGKADRLYVVKGGEVNLEYALGDGRRVVVDTLVAGDMVGWSAFLVQRSWTATCRANRDSQLVSVDAVGLRDLCEERPDLGHRVMREVAYALAHRLEGARVQLAALSA